MTAPVDHPPTEQPAGQEPPPRPAEKRGIEDRSWLLFAAVVLFIALAFIGMVVLTALGGGTTYVR
ncbi:hypothetical protein [Geodermatophilus sp. FMUSA9-8]|uniref:hypothetical protein n=1 Tax=Geodermatophilus sp. FMUSA9-8 TaxID=3120155 RepID=UPI00300A80A4